jgi:hypothetical protein
MGLSNTYRSASTSIYTHVARLFIPSFYPSLSPRIACPVSSSFYPSLSPRIACPVSLSARTLHVFLSLVISTHACPVSFALHVLSPMSCHLADDAVRVLSAREAAMDSLGCRRPNQVAAPVERRNENVFRIPDNLVKKCFIRNVAMWYPLAPRAHAGLPVMP